MFQQKSYQYYMKTDRCVEVAKILKRAIKINSNLFTIFQDSENDDDNPILCSISKLISDLSNIDYELLPHDFYSTISHSFQVVIQHLNQYKLQHNNNDNNKNNDSFHCYELNRLKAIVLFACFHFNLWYKCRVACCDPQCQFEKRNKSDNNSVNDENLNKFDGKIWIDIYYKMYEKEFEYECNNNHIKESLFTCFNPSSSTNNVAVFLYSQCENPITFYDIHKLLISKKYSNNDECKHDFDCAFKNFDLLFQKIQYKELYFNYNMKTYDEIKNLFFKQYCSNFKNDNINNDNNNNHTNKQEIPCFLNQPMTFKECIEQIKKINNNDDDYDANYNGKIITGIEDEKMVETKYEGSIRFLKVQWKNCLVASWEPYFAIANKDPVQLQEYLTNTKTSMFGISLKESNINCKNDKIFSFYNEQSGYLPRDCECENDTNNYETCNHDNSSITNHQGVFNENLVHQLKCFSNDKAKKLYDQRKQLQNCTQSGQTNNDDTHGNISENINTNSNANMKHDLKMGTCIEIKPSDIQHNNGNDTFKIRLSLPHIKQSDDNDDNGFAINE